MQLQPDIIVAKLSKLTGGKGLSPEYLESSRSLATESDTITFGSMTRLSTSRARYDSLCIGGNFLGTFQYVKSRNPIIRNNSADRHTGEQERQVIIAQYRGPSWLINRVWSIQAVKASFGWTFSPRTYTVVPWNSPAFHYAGDNNVKGLQELFSKNLASPWDRNEFDYTLLIVSA